MLDEAGRAAGALMMLRFCRRSTTDRTLTEWLNDAFDGLVNSAAHKVNWFHDPVIRCDTSRLAAGERWRDVWNTDSADDNFIDATVHIEAGMTCMFYSVTFKLPVKVTKSETESDR